MMQFSLFQFAQRLAMTAALSHLRIHVRTDEHIDFDGEPVDASLPMAALLAPYVARAPAPLVDLRYDDPASYEAIGKVIYGCQRIGLTLASVNGRPPVGGPAASQH
jgi:hypothetical protein